MKDRAFRLNVAFVPIAAKKAARADQAVVMIPPESDLADKVEVEFRRSTAVDISDEKSWRRCQRPP